MQQTISFQFTNLSRMLLQNLLQAQMNMLGTVVQPLPPVQQQMLHALPPEPTFVPTPPPPSQSPPPTQE